VGPTVAQMRDQQAARADRAQFAKNNHGAPPIAAKGAPSRAPARLGPAGSAAHPAVPAGAAAHPAHQVAAVHPARHATAHGHAASHGSHRASRSHYSHSNSHFLPPFHLGPFVLGPFVLGPFLLWPFVQPFVHPLGLRAAFRRRRPRRIGVPCDGEPPIVRAGSFGRAKPRRLGAPGRWRETAPVAAAGRPRFSPIARNTGPAFYPTRRGRPPRRRSARRSRPPPPPPSPASRRPADEGFAAAAPGGPNGQCSCRSRR